MAYDFQYTVTIVVFHAALSSEEIQSLLPGLPSVNSLSVGEEIRIPGSESRRASRSVWRSRLHSDEKLSSEECPLDEFLEDILPSLLPLTGAFSQLQSAGEAFIDIDWFTDSHHSVSVIPPTVFRLLAMLGLSVYIEHYC